MYENLNKLYYKLSREEYENVYQKRFNDESTIKLDFIIKDNPVFVVITHQMLHDIAEIYKIDKQVAKYYQKMPKIAIEQFTRKCLIDEIILTNKIEGVKSTRREISELLDELHDKSDNQRVKQRFSGIVHHYAVLDYLDQNKTIVVDTCQDIRGIYDTLVLQDIVADNPNNEPDGNIFRKDSVSITTATEKIIHQGIYPEKEIIKNMDKALKILHDDSLQGLLRIIIFHYLFEYIHPFYDGNGRLGRYLLSYTIRDELEQLMAYRLSYTIHEHKNEYEKAFVICNDKTNKGDLTPFVLKMLSFIKESEENLLEALEERADLITKYAKIIIDLELNEKQKELCGILLQASLFSENGINTKELMRILEIKQYITLKNRLDVLEKNQLLIKQTIGRENHYLLSLETLDKLVK